MSVYDAYDHFHAHLGTFYSPEKAPKATRVLDGRKQIASENRQHWLWDDEAIAPLRTMPDVGGATFLISERKIIFKPTEKRLANPFTKVTGHTLITADPLIYLLDHPEMEEDTPFLLVSIHSKRPVSCLSNWYMTREISSTIACFPSGSKQPLEFQVYDIPMIRSARTELEQMLNSFGANYTRTAKAEVHDILASFSDRKIKEKSKRNLGELHKDHPDVVNLVKMFRPHEIDLLISLFF